MKIFARTEGFNIRTERINDSDSVFIEGIAMVCDTPSRNGVIYTSESVQKNFKTLIGKPMTFNHDENKVVGHITDAYFENGKLYYKADLDPEEQIVRKIKRGDINKVSIQVMTENTVNYKEYVKTDVKEFLELSVVTIPGFEDTSIQLAEALKKEYDARYQNPDGTFKKMTEPDEPNGTPTKFGGCVRYQMANGHSLDSAKKICGYIAKKKGASFKITNDEVDNMVNKEQDENPKEPEQPTEPKKDEEPKQEQNEDIMALLNEVNAKLDKLLAMEQTEQEPEAPEEPEKQEKLERGAKFSAEKEESVKLSDITKEIAKLI